jgi:ubiquinone/menaquinone biosynthesis C-methylase UbiE
VLIDPDGVERAAIAELVDLAGLRVLEVGCGDGRLTFLYGGEAASVLAIDADDESIERARADLPVDLAGHVRFEAVDAAQADLPSAEFDLALFSWSL